MVSASTVILLSLQLVATITMAWATLPQTKDVSSSPLIESDMTLPVRALRGDRDGSFGRLNAIPLPPGVLAVQPPVMITLWSNFAVALGIGLLIGLERERSKAGQRASAGIRTFAMASLLG
ncbi:MAG: hypothetical protein M1823_008485, partial [Watsoniomyces obsoletus]